jgi:hypothetical protein
MPYGMTCVAAFPVQSPPMWRVGEAVRHRHNPDLDALNEATVVAACERLGLRVEQQRNRGAYSIDLGNEALVDSLPGLAGNASFLGTFDRQDAVEDETLDYFAAGHPLVEAILAHLDESPMGRVAVLGIDAKENGLALQSIRRLAAALPASRRPVAVAALVTGG